MEIFAKLAMYAIDHAVQVSTLIAACCTLIASCVSAFLSLRNREKLHQITNGQQKAVEVAQAKLEAELRSNSHKDGQ